MGGGKLPHLDHMGSRVKGIDWLGHSATPDAYMRPVGSIPDEFSERWYWSFGTLDGESYKAGLLCPLMFIWNL